MDKCFTLVFVTVVVASVIHGCTVGVRHGNRIAIRVAIENITSAGFETRGFGRHSLRISEAGGNSTLEFVVLRTGPDPAVTAAMGVCIEALNLSTEQVETAAAAFRSADAASQGLAFDDLRAQMIAALETSRTCAKDCFVELGPDDSDAAHQLPSACATQMLRHLQVWIDAEELCLQFLDLEFNRLQLTSRWSRSSNSSELSEP